MIKYIKKNYFNNCYIYLYYSNRYYKIIVDKSSENKNNVDIYKQDKRGKLFSSYKHIGKFLDFNSAKNYLKLIAKAV